MDDYWYSATRQNNAWCSAGSWAYGTSAGLAATEFYATPLSKWIKYQFEIGKYMQTPAIVIPVAEEEQMEVDERDFDNYISQFHVRSEIKP